LYRPSEALARNDGRRDSRDGRVDPGQRSGGGGLREKVQRQGGGGAAGQRVPSVVGRRRRGGHQAGAAARRRARLRPAQPDTGPGGHTAGARPPGDEPQRQVDGGHARGGDRGPGRPGG